MRNVLRVVFLVALVSAPAFANTNKTHQFKHTILSIEKTVVDLADVTILLRCQEFILLRTNMTEADAQKVIKLIQEKHLTAGQAFIGIYSICALPEEAYWRVTLPLLTSNTDQDLLARVLAWPLPYGPGFANAFKNKTCKDKLEGLKRDKKTSARVKKNIELILGGKAANTYDQFKKRPDIFGY